MGTICELYIGTHTGSRWQGYKGGICFGVLYGISSLQVSITSADIMEDDLWNEYTWLSVRVCNARGCCCLGYTIIQVVGDRRGIQTRRRERNRHWTTTCHR